MVKKVKRDQPAAPVKRQFVKTNWRRRWEGGVGWGGWGRRRRLP